jgi:hypothetical protein
MKETKYASQCAYLADYVKCATISDCPDLLKTICTTKQISTCSLKSCPYVVTSANMVDASALTELLSGSPRNFVIRHESTQSSLMVVGAVVAVAALVVVAAAILVRNRRTPSNQYSALLDEEQQ